jgi:hypothetical protein
MTDNTATTFWNAPRLSPAAEAELRSLYEQLDAEVARLGPVCRLSGRCCRFKEHDHTLFVSTAEVQLLLGNAPKPVRPLDSGETCPWQDDRGHCTARESRPLGCRVYYCDPAYEPSAHELSERSIARLKTLANDHGLSWNYAPLHQHLEASLHQEIVPDQLSEASTCVLDSRNGNRESPDGSFLTLL